MMQWLCILLCLGIARAETTLRSEAVPSQDEITEVSTEVLSVLVGETDLEIRILRFLVPRKGYEYRIAIAGFDDRAEAMKTQELLERNNLLFSIDSDEPVPTIEVIPEMTPSIEVVPKISKENEDPNIFQRMTEVRQTPTSDEILQLALKNYSILGQTYRDSKWEQLLYTRSFVGEEERKVKHEFYRQDTAIRLDVRITKGAGVDSTSILTEDGKVWLKTNDGQTQKDERRGREVLNRFSAAHILSIPMGFDIDVQTDGPWRALDTVKKSDKGWIISRQHAGGADGLLEAEFESDTWFLTRVVWLESGEERELNFSHFAELDNSGALFPQKIELRIENEIVEKISISTFTLNELNDNNLFKLSE
jgi:hypothetical protein